MAKTDSNVVISAFTEQQVERLTGVTMRQLRYWDGTGFFKPRFGYAERQLPYSRIYSFRDMVCLKVLNELRNKAKVPLPHLRQVKLKLAKLGEDLWAKTTLYVLNKRVVFDNPDTEKKEEVVTGQTVFEIPLHVVVGDIQKRIDEMRARKPTSVGQLERRRGLVHNQWVISGTRVPVRGIQEFSAAGYTNEQILKQYPSLTLEDIKAALSHGKAA